MFLTCQIVKTKKSNFMQKNIFKAIIMHKAVKITNKDIKHY